MEEISLEDQIYICKYIEDVGITEIKASLGHKYSKEQIEKLVNALKSNGIYKQYKNMPYSEWENKIKQPLKKRGRPKKQCVNEPVKADNKDIILNEVNPDNENYISEYYRGKADALEQIIRYILGGK